MLGLVAVTVLLVCDSLTPSDYGELTINPFEVDWGSMSWNNIDVNSLIHTILSAIIGFILTIIVVEMLLRASREREQQNKRDLQFKNISKIIQVPLLKYERAVLSLTYGRGHIPKDKKVKVPVEAKDFIHVFEPQAYVNELLFQSNIELYANAVDSLLACITNILLNVDLTNNEELSELLSRYVKVVSATNPCRLIIDMQNQYTGTEKMVDAIRKELPTIDLDTVKPTNLYAPFVDLKLMIEYHEVFIKRLYLLAPSFKFNFNAK